MLKRTTLLSILLAASIVFAVSSAYQLWEAGPWELPKPGKAREPAPSEEPEAEEAESRPPQVANTKTIVDRNLFDPERGRNRTPGDEVSSGAMQRVRSLVLLGTAILGNSRHAILEEPGKAAAPGKAPAGGAAQIRFKQGDSWEGFKLSEVREESVVFTRGASRVELALDYSRPNVSSAPRTPAAPAAAPRVVAPAQPEARVQTERQAPRRNAVRDKADKEAERAAKAERNRAARVEKERRPPRQQRQLQAPQQPSSTPESAPAQSPQ